jgi:hypothetical protein
MECEMTGLGQARIAPCSNTLQQREKALPDQFGGSCI